MSPTFADHLARAAALPPTPPADATGWPTYLGAVLVVLVATIALFEVAFRAFFRWETRNTLARAREILEARRVARIVAGTATPSDYHEEAAREARPAARGLHRVR